MSGAMKSFSKLIGVGGEDVTVNATFWKMAGWREIALITFSFLVQTSFIANFLTLFLNKWKLFVTRPKKWINLLKSVFLSVLSVFYASERRFISLVTSFSNVMTTFN